MKNVKIALLGLGNVGRGVWNILNENKDQIIKRSGYEVEVAKILVRDKSKNRGLNVPEETLTTDFEEILNDDSIKIVVEVMGGIEPAKDYLLRAMSKKKHIVTANKMLLASCGDEVLQKADEEGVMFYYEASVAGGIPIIKGISESLTANKITELYGIVNGTTNYILSKMELNGEEFNEVLKEAQVKGYAEADPTADVEGFDALYKLVILSSLAFGTKVTPDDVNREGISKITKEDMKFAEEFGMSIKMLAIAKRKNGSLELRVHPTMIPDTHPLANVYDAFNAVFINGNAVGDLMFYGKGAGDMPTGSAVVSDIIAILRSNIDIENINPVVKNNLWNMSIRPMGEVESRYYIRLTVGDKPGVLGQITTIFGSNKVSLKTVIQKGRKDDANTDVILVLITHAIKESLLMDAIERLNDLKTVKGVDNIIRIEDFK